MHFVRVMIQSRGAMGIYEHVVITTEGLNEIQSSNADPDTHTHGITDANPVLQF